MFDFLFVVFGHLLEGCWHLAQADGRPHVRTFCLGCGGLAAIALVVGLIAFLCR